MKKLLALAAVLTVAISLTGCAGDVTSESIPVVENEFELITEEAEVIVDTLEAEEHEYEPMKLSDTLKKENAPREVRIPAGYPIAKGAPDPAPLPIELLCPDGAEIFAEDIIRIDGQEDLSPNELTEDNWSSIECGGFTYLALPAVPTVNSIDNADIYNAGTGEFDGIPNITPAEYKRYYEGDSVCGLKIISANSYFSRGNIDYTYYEVDGEFKTFKELGVPFGYFSGASVMLEGSVSVTGYMNLAAEDEHYINKGDIGFIPDSSCTLPVMKFSMSPSGLNGYTDYCSENGMNWVTEYPPFMLGSGNDSRYSHLPFDDIPADGSYVKVSATLSDITMTCTDKGAYITATVTSLELL